jgi:hypothetical protein
VDNIRHHVKLFEAEEAESLDHPEPEDFDYECDDCHHSSVGCHEARCGGEIHPNPFDYSSSVKRINELTALINGRR